MAKESPTTDVITFDLQSVFSVPRLSSNVVFYKRQLSVYNLGIHDCATETAYMNVWDETTASRGAQEIASCLRKYLTSNGNQGNKTELILWSDSCGGQNRNIKMALMLFQLVQDPTMPYTTITQKFLESGHSFFTERFGLHGIPNSTGNPFIGGVKYTGGGKIGDFRRTSPFISETVRDRPMVTMER